MELTGYFEVGRPKCIFPVPDPLKGFKSPNDFKIMIEPKEKDFHFVDFYMSKSYYFVKEKTSKKFCAQFGLVCRLCRKVMTDRLRMAKNGNPAGRPRRTFPQIEGR
jgi:hypothetical protein